MSIPDCNNSDSSPITIADTCQFYNQITVEFKIKSNVSNRSSRLSLTILSLIWNPQFHSSSFFRPYNSNCCHVNLTPILRKKWFPFYFSYLQITLGRQYQNNLTIYSIWSQSGHFDFVHTDACILFRVHLRLWNRIKIRTKCESGYIF